MTDSVALTRILTNPAALPAEEEFAELDSLSQMATAHGVHALLYSALRTNDTLKCPENLKQAAFRQAAVFQLRDEELERVCRGLSDAGVRYLLIKGAALCHQIYPSPELRPRVDTDILIEESSLSVTKEVLASLGYETIIAHDGGLVSFQTGMRYTDGCSVSHTIDIHWRLTNRQEYRDILEFDSIYNAAVTLPRFPFEVYAPNDVFALCLACLHLVGHHSDNPRLIWLYDMLLLLRQMDASDLEYFAGLIKDNTLETVTVKALNELGRHFEVENLPPLLTLLGNVNDANLTRESRLALLRSNLSALPTVDSRARYLFALAFPPVEYIEKQFNPPSRLLVPWFYLYRILKGSVKILTSGATSSNENRPT